MPSDDEEDFGHTGFIDKEKRARGPAVKGPAPKELRKPVTDLAEQLGIVTESGFKVYEQIKPGTYQINIDGRQINATALATSLGATFADEHPDISVTPDVAARVLERLFEASARRTVTEYVDIGYVIARSAHDMLTSRGLYKEKEYMESVPPPDLEKQVKEMEKKARGLERKKEQLSKLFGITDFSPEGLESFLAAMDEFRATETYQHRDLATPQAITQLRRELEGSRNPAVQPFLDVIEKAAEKRRFRVTASRHGVTRAGREVDTERAVVFTVYDDDMDQFLVQMDMLKDGLQTREDVRNAIGTAAALQGLIPVDRKNSPEASVTVDYMASRDPTIQIYDIPPQRAEIYERVLEQRGIIFARDEGKKGATLTFNVPEDVTQRVALVEGFATAFPQRSADEDIAEHDTQFGVSMPRPKAKREESNPDRTDVDPPEQPKKKGWRWWRRDDGGQDADSGRGGGGGQ